MEPERDIGTLDCVINPSVVADLGSSAPGILSRVYVDRSDFVESDDVIAELESGVEAASVDLARTRADSTAEVDLRRTNAAFGNRLRDRTKDLFQRRVVSNNDLDERETEAKLGWIQLRQAQDNQSIAKLELVRAEEILKRRTITSPITGVVMERFKVVGEYIEDQPVVRVAQLDPLHVEVIVPVEHLGAVKQGMTAEVWTEVVEDRRWRAEVMRVDKVADVASGTYGVRLSLPNPDYQIPAGLRCQMKLVDSSQRIAFATPPLQPMTEPAENPMRTQAERAFREPEPPARKEMARPETNEPQVAKATITAQPMTTNQDVEPLPQVEAVSTVKDAPEPAPEPSSAVKESKPVNETAPDIRDTVTKPAPVSDDATQVSTASKATPVETIRTEPAKVARVENSAAQAIEDRRVCRIAGPFKTEIEATRHVVKLRRAGLDVEMQSAGKPTDVEYKVMTPVLADKAAADAVLELLTTADLDDFFVQKLPAGKRRVYLGLYNQQALAEQRLATLREAGVKAIFRPSKTVGSDFFLVVRGLPGRDTDRLLAALPASPAGAAGKLGLCEHGEAISMR